MVCIIMRLSLISLTASHIWPTERVRALLSQVVRGEEGGASVNCCLRLPASLLLPFEPGKNTCLGLERQHMVMLCKTKGHVKADVARPQDLLSIAWENRGCLRINILP